MTDKHDSTHCIAWFIAGAAIGLAIGMLYAPKSGRETRELLKEKAEEIKEKAAETIEKAKESAAEARKKMEEKLGRAKHEEAS